jgi:hypothetical protein
LYNIKAIPTPYAGVNFRSRLEAKWAAFFDLVGWRWQYEPLDFDGWIPDFVLHGRKQRVLVEVKPLYSADEALFGLLSRQTVAARSRDDILVLGADIIPEAKYFSCIAFGWLGEYCGRDHGWAEAIPHNGKGLGFCSSLHTYSNRISGFYDGDNGAGSDTQDGAIVDLWRKAGNAVQWKPDNDNYQSVRATVDRGLRKAA